MSEIFYDSNGQPKFALLPYDEYAELLDALEFQTNTAQKYNALFEEAKEMLQAELSKTNSSSEGFRPNNNDRFFQQARGRYLDSRLFLVYKGSRARKFANDSFVNDSYKMKIRDELVRAGVLAEDRSGLFYVFTRDYEFPNPSIAASIVCGGSKSGPDAWGRPEGR